MSRSSKPVFRLDNLDSELRRAAELQPAVNYADPAAVRATLNRALKLSRRIGRAAREADGLAIEDHTVAARPGSPPIPVRIYEASARPRPGPALVFFHGGAFVAGDLDTEDARCREIARRTGVLVVSVDYRLAPEHPYPAGLEDCFDAVSWVAAHDTAFDVDPARIVVGGSSAGGALTAAVAMAARDAGGPAIALQMLLYPVVDDRLATMSMHRFTTTPGWNQPNSVHMWRHYLGAGHAAATRPYAVPGRTPDLSGLPPAYVMTVEFDPLRDEGIGYARRLVDAEVSTELHNFPRAFHGFDAAAPRAALSRRSLDEQCAVLARATGVVVTPADDVVTTGSRVPVAET